MSYKIKYICVCNKGNVRRTNQDNYICNTEYRDNDTENLNTPLQGVLDADNNSLLGVFDGMGGESCGDIASLLTAQRAANRKKSGHPVEDLLVLCHEANQDICNFMNKNHISSMGTTAAMLAFGKKELIICNIGDTRIYRYAGRKLKQVSVDHVVSIIPGKKPPLSQHLGIPSDEMLIQPHIAGVPYQDKNIYLIASDGLTDMVAETRIEEVICKYSIEDSAKILLKEALKNGGKDNITIILCQIEAFGLMNKMKKMFDIR